MTQPALAAHSPEAILVGNQGVVADISSDKQAFHVPWGKAMMWIFLLSDTFIFSCFLISYMTVRISTTVPWPNPSEVFALSFGGDPIPLILIAIMTFVLITSSGTMALAVNFGYRKNKKLTVLLMMATALLGATFVGMQAFEWTKLIMDEGVRPWGNPMGAAQAGVIYLSVVAWRVGTGFYDRKKGGNYETVEIAGLYWHFVDLVWVFIFAFFYLW
jgi:cytochrome c oxidase subunit III